MNTIFIVSVLSALLVVGLFFLYVYKISKEENKDVELFAETQRIIMESATLETYHRNLYGQRVTVSHVLDSGKEYLIINSNQEFLNNLKDNVKKSKERGFKNLFETFDCKTSKEIHRFTNVVLEGCIDLTTLLSVSGVEKRLKKNNHKHLIIEHNG